MFNNFPLHLPSFYEHEFGPKNPMRDDTVPAADPLRALYDEPSTFDHSSLPELPTMQHHSTSRALAK